MGHGGQRDELSQGRVSYRRLGMRDALTLSTDVKSRDGSAARQKHSLTNVHTSPRNTVMKHLAILLLAHVLLFSSVGALSAQTSSGTPNPSNASPNTAKSNSAKSTLTPTQRANQWRYRWHNGQWWYWTENNQWVYWSNGRWTTYGAQTHVVGMRPSPGQQGQFLPGMQTGAAYGLGGTFGGTQPTHYSDSRQGGNYSPNTGHSSGYSWGDTRNNGSGND